jgi:hypothetical protein
MFTFIVQKYKWKKYKAEKCVVKKSKLGAELFMTHIPSGVVICRNRLLHNMHYTAYIYLIGDLEYNLTNYQTQRSLPNRRTLAQQVGETVMVNGWLLHGNNEVLSLWEARVQCYNKYNNLLTLVSDDHIDYLTRRLAHICNSINSMTDLLGEILYEKSN